MALGLLCFACSGKGITGVPDASLDTAGDLAPDAEVDTTQDPLADTADDAPADPPADTADDLDLDVATDTRQDAPDDPALDVPGDASDVTGEDAPEVCGDLAATPTNVQAWTLCFMGTGTHASFTLLFTNAHACDIHSVAVTSGSVRVASDDSILYGFGPLTPTTPFSGTVPAGSSSSVDFHAFDPMDASSLDGTPVYVQAQVSWAGGGPLDVKTGDTDLTCVY